MPADITDSATHACLVGYARHLQRMHFGLAHALLGTSDTIQWAVQRREVALHRPTSHRALVIGAGQGTTGTTSLALALQILNLTTWHAAEVYRPPPGSRNIQTSWRNPFLNARGNELIRLENNNSVVGDARACNAKLDALDYRVPSKTHAIVDSPAPDSFLDFFWAHPNALVVLTTRPAEEWVNRRIAGHSDPGGLLPVDRPCGARLTLWPRNLSAALLHAYEQLVRCVTPRHRLLELCLPCMEAAPGGRSMIRLARFLHLRTAPGLDDAFPFGRTVAARRVARRRRPSSGGSS